MGPFGPSSGAAVSREWSLSAEVRAVLVCPICRGELEDSKLGLACASDRLVFPVKQGVPMMLKELALPFDEGNLAKRS